MISERDKEIIKDAHRVNKAMGIDDAFTFIIEVKNTTIELLDRLNKSLEDCIRHKR